MSSTMQIMIAYTTAILENISSWLCAEPMIYFTGMLIGCFVINMILMLFRGGTRR